MTNPALEAHVEKTVGYETYEAKWLSLPWYSKLFYKIRGWEPGGRKGAPPLR